MAGATFKTRGGGSPGQLIARIVTAVKPTEGDLLHAGELLKARILTRTAAGLDFRGQAFAPYSTKGPFYFYPGGKVGKSRKGIFTASRRGSAGRLQKKIGGSLTRSRVGIKFDSYAAFKAAMGRGTVDLYGISAPHMLQAIVVQAKGNTILLGIYGDEAGRATGHHLGNPRTHLPQRDFWGASPEDLAMMLKDLKYRATTRAREALAA